MSMGFLERYYFESLVSKALLARQPGEHFLFNLAGEQSQFVRLNGAKVRQIGTVSDADLHVTLVLEGPGQVLRTASASTTLSGLSYIDSERVTGLLTHLRKETPELPADPYASLPESKNGSEFEKRGELPGASDAPDAILAQVSGLDIAGIYAAGTVVRAMANSEGLRHWFSTSNFNLDYSLYTPTQRALKGTYAGNSWNVDRYAARVRAEREKLALLDRPARKLQRGSYRAYLEPAAYGDLIQMLSWGGVSEASIRQGDSPLRLMRGAGSSAKKLSGEFSLLEDFSSGMVPRFNSEGELAPERLALVDQGRLASTLVSTRTSLEYSTPSNGAEDHEAMRAPSISTGKLATSEILRRLDRGVYLSNLHYLNWSDQPGGRVTGMTRYACFWVENGKIIEPIENMRFDDSIFSLFGESLEDLTQEAAYLPEVHTYGRREIGGMSCPGALLKSMEFTL